MRPAPYTNRFADDLSRESSISTLSSVLSRFKVDRFAWNAAVWIYERLFERGKVVANILCKSLCSYNRAPHRYRNYEKNTYV